MGVSTIEWTDYTFNPWKGCQKVSPGCKNCYAEADVEKRRKIAKFGPHKGGGTRSVTSPGNWNLPYKWNRLAMEARQVKKVFCASEADIFEDWDGPMLAGFGKEAKGSALEIQPDGAWYLNGLIRLSFRNTRPMTMQDLRNQVFRMIEATPWLIWILVTKRPENVMRMVPQGWREAFPNNVWMVTSVEDAKHLKKRVPPLLEIPAQVLGLSCEPLIGSLTFQPQKRYLSFLEAGCSDSRLDWIICGGESGTCARPMHPEWARSIRDECAEHGTPFFFKQWGTWLPGHHFTDECHARERKYAEDGCGSRWECMDWDEDGKAFESGSHWADDIGEHAMFKVGKKLAGRELDGTEHQAFPRHLAFYQEQMEATLV